MVNDLNQRNLLKRNKVRVYDWEELFDIYYYVKQDMIREYVC